MPDSMPDMPDRILETIPDIMPESMSEYTLVRMSEDTPERMPEIMSGNMSDRKSSSHATMGITRKIVYLKNCLSQWFSYRAMTWAGLCGGLFLRIADQVPISSRPVFVWTPWKWWFLFRYRLGSGQCMPTVFDSLWCLPFATGPLMADAWMTARSWISLLIHKSPCGSATSSHP